VIVMPSNSNATSDSHLNIIVPVERPLEQEICTIQEEQIQIVQEAVEMGANSRSEVIKVKKTRRKREQCAVWDPSKVEGDPNARPKRACKQTEFIQLEDHRIRKKDRVDFRYVRVSEVVVGQGETEFQVINNREERFETWHDGSSVSNWSLTGWTRFVSLPLSSWRGSIGSMVRRIGISSSIREPENDENSNYIPLCSLQSPRVHQP